MFCYCFILLLIFIFIQIFSFYFYFFVFVLYLVPFSCCYCANIVMGLFGCNVMASHPVQRLNGSDGFFYFTKPILGKKLFPCFIVVANCVMYDNGKRHKKKTRKVGQCRDNNNKQLLLLIHKQSKVDYSSRPAAE